MTKHFFPATLPNGVVSSLCGIITIHVDKIGWKGHGKYCAHCMKKCDKQFAPSEKVNGP